MNILLLKQLIAYWSNKFKILPENFDNKGTSFIPNSDLNEQEIIVLKIEKHNFIFYPAFFPFLLAANKFSRTPLLPIDRCS